MKSVGAAKTTDETTAWERVLAIKIAADRATAAKEFLTSYPDSKFAEQARNLFVTSQIEEGDLRMQAGALEKAASLIATAIREASSPLDEKLFKEVLSKLPARLYFGGAREAGLRVAALIEQKVRGSVDQLLAMANFYLSVENGTKGRELSEAAIKLNSESSAAYETLGLACRMDFQIEEAAAAYDKALQLQPDSISARRGLAEMKRALGKPDEAMRLFQEILSKDGGNVPARTGLILSMLEAGKQSEAETELAKSLNENPGNIMLLTGAAHYYVVQDNGEKAVELAQKAIDIDPRYIWSHIALARGLVLLNKPYDAERTLLAARRYGNFPTLEYELAVTRMAAGFFRDASEDLAKAFVISDGSIRTKLGGRIDRSSKNFSELVGLERRASILSPLGASKPEIDSKLFSLLELKQNIDTEIPIREALLRSVEQFVEGNDGMKLHRQLFAAGVLLDKKIELAAASDLAQAAVGNVDAGLDSPFSRSAIMAGQLYEDRNIAVARGQYLNLPEVPRSTLSAITRGRIEEIIGWAKYQMGDAPAAVVRLKRAVSVLPSKSAWWQSASWRLGTALAASGQDAEALDIYIQAFKSGNASDIFRYETIAGLYRKIHGNTDQLDSLIGPDPRTPAISALQGIQSDTASVLKTAENAGVEKQASASTVVRTSNDVLGNASPVSSPIPPADSTNNSSLKTLQPVETPKDSRPELVQASAASALAEKASANAKSTVEKLNMFSPVVITIPAAEATGRAVNKSIPFLPNPLLKSDTKDNGVGKHTSPPVDQEPNSVTEPAITSGATTKSPDISVPCLLSSTEDSLSIQSDGGEKAVVIGSEKDIDLGVLKAVSSSPELVSVRREPVVGIDSRALFVIKAAPKSQGVYQITFALPCGEKVIVVNVR